MSEANMPKQLRSKVIFPLNPINLASLITLEVGRVKNKFNKL